jgi:exodeoxyribonuclease VII large subunit
MDLIDDPQPGENAPEFSVSEISGAVKRMIEGEFARVRIRGEVGRVVWARSGHLYFDLKDENAVLAAVSWKGQAARLPVKPEEGMEVVATGRLTTFPGQSKYQMIVDDVRPAGVGALMAMLDKRRKELEAEGLFDPARKRPLPYLPDVIGVVTSPTGAVIRDILHRLRDRFPRRVLVWPVAVQGDRCAPEVAAAIAGFNRLSPGGAIPRPDLIIVARGGGSIEDLWGFNEEIVVRAAAASDIPLISAVGHETDTTLIDHASDRRAPTPTAAAELAVPVRLDLLTWVGEQEARLSRAIGQGITRRRQRTDDLARALPRLDALLTGPRQRLDAADRALPLVLRGVTQKKSARLSEIGAAIRPATLRSRIRDQERALRAVSEGHLPSLSRLLRRKREALEQRLARFSPDRLAREMRDSRTALADWSRRLGMAAAAQEARRGERLGALDRTRLTLGYEATLARGYAVVWNGDSLVSDAASVTGGQPLEVQFRDGRLAVVSAGSAPPKPKKAPPKPDQGSLF